MTKTKSTKRALLMSALALLMCVSMLIGSTFAWFTDSVTSAGNTIQSGTLKVDLENAAGDSIVGQSLSFVKASGHESEAILWEPGCTYELTPVYVHNEGTLALKYKVVINGLDGDAKLLEAIEWSVKVGDQEDVDLADFEETLNAGAKSEKAIVLVGHMKEEANNDYQGLTAEGISITVLATQDTVEYDSFGNQYDANAKYPVADSTELATVLKTATAGSTIQLAAGEYELPLMKATQSGITIKGTAGTKITGNTNSQYKDITFENVEFAGDIKATFNGNSTVKNCTFTSAGLEPSCSVAATATLTVEGCTFNGVAGEAALHFGGKDGGTVVIKDCVFNKGYVAFGKAMNVTFERCDFNGAVASCYGSYTFNNCTFDADAMVYIYPSSPNEVVTVTMDGCSVEGGADVKTVCYNTGNSVDGTTKQFSIDGTTVDHSDLQAYPSN